MPEAGPRTVRIVLVDDHALFRNALAQDLGKEEDFEVAGASGSVKEALELVKKEPVDVVLLDIDLGQEEGGEFLRQARKDGFRGKVIIVTVGVHYWEAVRLLRSGASAIFPKHGTDESLFRIIRDVVSGRAAPPPIADAEPAGEAAIGRPAHRALTVRQCQVLRLVVEGKANKEIAVELELRESQVKEALQGLFLKTGVRTRAQLTRLAIERYWDEVAAFPSGVASPPES